MRTVVSSRGVRCLHLLDLPLLRHPHAPRRCYPRHYPTCDGVNARPVFHGMYITPHAVSVTSSGGGEAGVPGEPAGDESVIELE